MRDGGGVTDASKIEWVDRMTTGDWLTRRIIGCAYRVAKTLGAGFLEKVYENALVHELRKAGLHAAQQQPCRIVYDGIIVGEYVADLVVEDAVILELKAAKQLDAVHEAQLLNYLRASDRSLGLLLNFGSPRLGIRRLVL